MPIINLKAIPDDVKQFILREQAKRKKEKNVKQYSQELVIYQIIREYKKLQEKAA